jgi:hypothetical protein
VTGAGSGSFVYGYMSEQYWQEGLLGMFYLDVCEFPSCLALHKEVQIWDFPF